MSDHRPTTTRPATLGVGPRPGFGPGPGGPGGPFAGMAGGRAKNARGTVRRVWDYLRHQGKLLALVVFLVTLSTLLGLAGPYLMGKALDDYIGAKDLVGLARTLLIMLATYLGASASTYTQNRIMITVSQRTVREIRHDLFAKLQQLSLRFFDQRTHGELMSRLTNDVENINTVLSQSATQLISSILSIIGVAATILLLNWRLAMVTLVTVPVMLFITRWIAKHTRRGYREQQSSLGEVNGIIEESITGQRIIKAYGRESDTLADFEVANRRLQSAATKAQTLSGIMGPFGGVMNNSSTAIVAGAGGWMAVAGLATVGTVVSFVNYARQFMFPMMQIANLYNTIQSGIAGAERVFEILDEELDLPDAPDATALDEIQGDVVFDDVSFSYEPETPVLKHVSFHTLPGQTFALVGPTGAGKTTIVNLLTRFYDIDSGAIRVDGRDIRTVQKASLRRQLGIVLQDGFLFAATVKENIRYGRLDATDEEVVAAARLANADQFIRRLPMGYDTELSERGSNLSQGQRQLLSIARAMLADPRILILDEATSSVDTRTEIHIQDALLKLMEGRTSFVIAHRLSTIREADEVLVINDGEIIERGDHESLLAQQGFYYNLYMSQFRGKAVPREASA